MRIDRRAMILARGSGSVEIGDNFTLQMGAIIDGNNEAVTVGDNVSVSPYSILYGPLSVGNDVLIAAQCVIIPRNHIYRDAAIPIRAQGESKRPITIEDDVWLGAHVVVTEGVRIGRGAVIGASSVVTRDIPEFSIAVGVPARVVNLRTSISEKPSA